MSSRTVKVTLAAEVAGYVKGMEEAAKSTRETGTEAEKLAQKGQAIKDLGVAAMAMGAGAAAGVGLAVSKWADFDEAMSAVQAATHESEANMKLLGDAAMDAGARTVFSAEESANAIEELAKAGVSTKDILGGGLDGALDLAAAGGLGVAEAAGIAATALKTFGLEGTDMAHVADLLAAGAGKAMGDVTDLSAALNQSAMVANATGLSIEETTAGLAAFASQGLLGSDAGTSFKSMLQSLTPTSAKAAEEMERLGISAYDSQGNFIGLAEFAGNLQGALKGLSVEQQQAALKTIFGSDAIRAATVLYNEGEEGIREWTDAVNDQGYAAETARARLDNLKGDIEALGGALDTALIQTGSAANDVLRSMIQAVTSAVDAYNDLPEPLQGAALAAGVLTAGVGLLGGGLLLAIPQIAAFKTSLSTLGITAGAARTALSGIGSFLGGPWGMALTAAAGLAVILVGEKQRLVTNSKELAETLDAETGAVTDNSTAWAAAKLEQEGLLERGQRLGIASKDLTDAWLGNADALERVNERLELFKSNSEFRMENADWDGWSKDLALVDMAIEGSNEMLEEARDKHDRLKEATEGSGDAASDAAASTEEQTSALSAMNAEAETAAQSVSELADMIRNFGSAEFDTERATVAFYDSLDSLKENLDSGTASLDVTTAAGRATATEMLNTASRTNELAAATHAMGGSTEEVQAILETGRQAIINTRTALGDTTKQAEDYANKLMLTPEQIETMVALNGVTEAENALAQLARDRVATINVRANMPDLDGVEVSGNGRMGTFANGGIIAYENGGMHEFAAGGGINTGIYSGGTPLIKFAEPETQWEAFISGKPDQRDRNRQIWVESGERLGMGDVLKALASGSTSGGGGVNVGSVTFSNPQQRQNYRDLTDTLEQIGRERR